MYSNIDNKSVDSCCHVVTFVCMYWDVHLIRELYLFKTPVRPYKIDKHYPIHFRKHLGPK